MKQKIEIISGGIYGANGEYPIGTELEVAAVPDGWASKVRIVKAKAAADAKAVTNPAKSNKRIGLEKQAAALSITFGDDTSDEDLLAAIKTAKGKA
ncbi:hypothetical protein [Neotabrizicola sp. VNH66]|uniref:hypothetical protein n=1 Tax=Neotabrizicola sp. VNH66 TaxID=3400918 RepID=UPI003BFF3A9D